MPRFYSQRMLNPYHGIVNVVEIPGADAVSRDGVTWMLYIQGGVERDVKGSAVGSEVPLPDIKFGTWTRRMGLKRAPVRYVTDYGQLERLGNRLLAAVKARAALVPFPQGDRYELWLLDAQSALPLALLSSGCRESDAGTFDGVCWTAGQASRRSFRHTEDEGDGINHADQLERLVRKAAGSPPVAQWFRRGDDGSGIGLGCNRDLPQLAGRSLTSNAFPELLLRAEWASRSDSALVAAFLAWQAPWLLALQSLTRSTRRWLESAARTQALMVDQLYPNYPEIIDRTAMKAARVEAALRRCAPDAADDEPALTTFFVTGN